MGQGAKKSHENLTPAALKAFVAYYPWLAMLCPGFIPGLRCQLYHDHWSCQSL